MTRLKILPLISLVACASSPSLSAQTTGVEHPWMVDDFIVSLGGFLPSKSFKIRVDGQSPGSEIDFNDDLKITDRESTGDLTFHWRFGKKWSLAGQYYGTNDSSRAKLTEDIYWGDGMLRSGSNIGAGVELDLFRVFAGRTFFTEDSRHEFGLGAGLHWLQIGAFIDGEIFVDEQSTGFKKESVTADLPLPNVGAWYWRSLTSRWLLTSQLDWLSASIGDYSGSLWNASVGLKFQAWEHVGFGLDYQYFEIDLDISKSDWKGNVKLIQDGPFISVTLNW
jgi:hypothetical protein